MLTEMKKADRETMASRIETLCASRGAGCERVDPSLRDPREIALDVSMSGAKVRIDFDGTKSKAENPDLFCMAWHMDHGSRAVYSDRFGAILGAPVNAIHRRKCTAFADGFEELSSLLSAALDAIASGDAFLKSAADAA